MSEFASICVLVSLWWPAYTSIFQQNVLYWFGCRIIWAAARTHNKVAAKRGLLHQLSHGLAAGVDAGPCYLVAVATAASPWPRPSSDGEEEECAASSEHGRIWHATGRVRCTRERLTPAGVNMHLTE